MFDRSLTVVFAIWNSQDSKIWRQETYIKNIQRVYYCNKFDHFKCLVRRGLAKYLVLLPAEAEQLTVN